jgi:hypothetical protein
LKNLGIGPVKHFVYMDLVKASISRHPVFINNGELVECELPVPDRHCPFYNDVVQCQIEQIEHIGIVGE